MKLLSWNINGIRAVHRRKQFLSFIANEDADVYCFQETKAHPDQLGDDLLNVEGYDCYFSSAEKKGYSGVAVYTRVAPLSVAHGMGIPEFDNEGRILLLEFEDFFLYNIYFPNGKMSPERLDYKMRFYAAFLKHANELRKKKSVVFCGDVNTAHKAIDLARPKQNEDVSGFLPEERAWMDEVVSAGFVDTFRMFESAGENYTWWHVMSGARKRNVGWRIDYFFVAEEMQQKVQKASIRPEVMGSDHCPVELHLKTA